MRIDNTIASYFLHSYNSHKLLQEMDMDLVTVVVLDGETLPISTCLIQHRLAHQFGSSLLLQEGHVLDPLILASGHVITPRACAGVK